MSEQRFITGPNVDGEVALNNMYERVGWKRVGHGSTAWSVPSAETALCQPQDGASDPRKRGLERADVQEIGPRALRLASEPEDARLTGGTRSLSRRLMGLNVTAKLEPRKPAAVARALSPRTQVA
ncbi:MAG TPA: hypothetical protein VIJ79_09070 [Acidobacteriaceae bacterium]